MKYLRLMEVNREKRAHFWKITVKGKNADVIEWGGTIPENNPETYKFTVENSGPDFLVLRLSDAKPEQTSMLCIDAKLGTFISMGFLTPGVVHDDQAASAFLGTCQNP